MRTKTKETGLVAIPSQPILEERLSGIIAEAKRLRLLIRTAKELERIEQDATATIEMEVDRG